MGAKGVALIIGLLLGVAYGGFSLRGLFFALLFGAAAFWLPNLLVYNAALRRQ